MRSVAIAQALVERVPTLEVHFILSQEAPYARSAPFATTLLPSSATFHSAAVIGVLERLRPRVVVFDNAGRTAQLKAASRLGAHVVFISARPRQRRRAFRLSWMALIDEHWIAYPAFTAGPLRWSERFKLHWLRRPVIRYLDVILARTAPTDVVLDPPSLPLPGFVLLVPGGGTGHPGAPDAVGVFRAAGLALAAGGIRCVLIAPQAGPPTHAAGLLHEMAVLPQWRLNAMLGMADVVVANGGSTLLQAIACGCASIGVPIAKDQGERIARCVQAGVALDAPLDAARIAQQVRTVCADETGRAALSARARALSLADGVQVAVAALQGYFDA